MLFTLSIYNVTEITLCDCEILKKRFCSINHPQCVFRLRNYMGDQKERLLGQNNFLRISTSQHSD